MQSTDILIWKGDTLHLDESPLENLKDIADKIREKENSISSGCWNGYIAEWIIENGNLYLKNIYSYSTSKNINKRLQKLLNKKFINGKLKVDWFSGSILGGYGRTLPSIYYIVYEKERLLNFENGKLISVTKFEAKNIEYSISEEKVKEFIYSNFNWILFDEDVDFNETISVFVKADFNGDLKEIKIEESVNEKIDNELIRVLKLIPNWGTYFWDGKPYIFFNDYYFRLNNENMKKYVR